MKSKDYTVIGQDIPFERIRRITGYLVGSVDRFNNTKKTAKKGFGIIRLLLITRRLKNKVRGLPY